MTRFLAASLFAFFIALPAWGAPTSGYDIEILVIENTLPELEGAETLAVPTPASLATELANADVGTNAAEQGGLADAIKRINRDDRFRVLTHKRWVQTADAKSATKPVRISDATQRLDGIFRFYLSRFLHVDLELVLRNAAGGESSEELVYHLSEHRRVKTQETHYFDHPKFGVLLRITQAGKS